MDICFTSNHLPQDLIEYHLVAREEDEEYFKEKIKVKLESYKRKLKDILKIESENEVPEECEEENFIEEVKNKLKSMESQLLYAIERKCSPSAYSKIEPIVKQTFS